MLTLSENAVMELKKFFEDRGETSPIRIYLAPGGCSGPRLALALDSARDDDDVVEQGGFSFCINKELFGQTGEISVDVSHMGFSVDSANSMGGGGGCCGCASSGGCSSAQ